MTSRNRNLTLVRVSYQCDNVLKQPSIEGDEVVELVVLNLGNEIMFYHIRLEEVHPNNRAHGKGALTRKAAADRIVRPSVLYEVAIALRLFIDYLH